MGFIYTARYVQDTGDSYIQDYVQDTGGSYIQDFPAMMEVSLAAADAVILGNNYYFSTKSVTIKLSKVVIWQSYHLTK